ncbi:MAG: helix-turn-helix transcriptional regulator, partial [Gemmatimonadetes bacterium]|nr:helix-turn-helix transcriptional regulator [Gemmatimonadota bacterium]
MIDPAELGQRIQERRKHQGLTQEQLGNDLLVSPQAVSKWENGESLPDIGTLPALCKALSTSADALLGIDSELGIETLGGKLGQRIGDLRDKEERHAALMTALGFLIPPYDMRKRNRDKNISYQLSDSDKGLVGFSFWSSSGLVCFAGGEVLEKDTPSSDMIDILRPLLAPECWPVACFLLRGPNKFAELFAAELAESSQALEDVVD